MRLIDADELRYAHRYARADPDSNKLVPVYAVDHKKIDEAPTVDAVPVVRCRECVYAYRVDGLMEEYDCRKMSFVVTWLPPEHFCSYGQRKDQSADVRKKEDNANG